MSHACTPILVGVASLVSEILLLSKTAKFPFWTMDYSPWSSKNLMDYNWLKKFMQVGIDIIIDTCTLVLVGMASLVSEILPLSNFGQIFLLDHDLSVFRDFAPPRLPLKMANTSFSNFCKSHMWLWIRERWHPTSDNNQHKHP